MKATLEAHSERSLDLKSLARLADCSRFHLVRAFRRAGMTRDAASLSSPCRIERAKSMLAREGLSVTDVCFEVGFESLGSFSSLFKGMVGRTPSRPTGPGPSPSARILGSTVPHC